MEIAKTKTNYFEVCDNLLKNLSQRARDVLFRRFGLSGEERETLDSIGKSYNLSRERVRQIENDSIKKIKKEEQFLKLDFLFENFFNYLKSEGGLKREDILLRTLSGEEKYNNHIFFLLNLNDKFNRFSQEKRFEIFWSLDKNARSFVEKTINSIINILKKESRLLALEEISQLIKKENETINLKNLASVLEVSKEILGNKTGRFGLKEWPEINPKGVKDKALLVLKEKQAPVHFKEITNLINEKIKEGHYKAGSGAPVLSQTVHNELIKNKRFVLVGRGIYGLNDWGYKPGVVKDVIADILKESKKPMEREEIVNKVLSQRLVKTSTIVLNLNDKKYFLKTKDGKYTIREA